MPSSSPSTRDRLLEAAGAVFAEHGFRAATVRKICEQAGANVAAVHYHFGDKAKLYNEVLRYAFEQAEARHPLRGPDTSSASFEETIETFVRTFLTRLYAAKASWHGKLVARELARPSAGFPVIVAAFSPAHTRLEAEIARARPRLDPERRRLHALSLLGQCVFFKHARPVLDALFGAESYPASEIPALAHHLATTFVRGLPAPEEAPCEH